MKLFDFSEALKRMKDGKLITRMGWATGPKKPFIFMVPGSRFEVNRHPLLGLFPEGTPIDYHSHVDMRIRDGRIVPWLCSQVDLFAEDWYEVELVKLEIVEADRPD
jgi:hypothetical protein